MCVQQRLKRVSDTQQRFRAFFLMANYLMMRAKIVFFVSLFICQNLLLNLKADSSLLSSQNESYYYHITQKDKRSYLSPYHDIKKYYNSLPKHLTPVEPLKDVLNWTEASGRRNIMLLKGDVVQEAGIFYGLASAALINSHPWYFGRMGMTESHIISNCHDGLSERVRKHALTNSNIFPNTIDFFQNKWCSTYKEYLQTMDLEIHWTRGKSPVQREAAVTLKSLQVLESWTWNKPWTKFLRNKTVLVVTAFPETVSRQYHQKRKLLFPSNPHVLPEFKKLIVLGAPLPNWNSTGKYNSTYMPKHTTLEEHSPVISGEYRFSDPEGSWYLEVESLKYRINQTFYDNGGFDVMLIGAGSLAVPAGSFVSKNLNKTVFIMAGAIQLLFGIKGTRWENRGQYRDYFWNEHWTYPPIVQGSENMEGSAYFQKPRENHKKGFSFGNQLQSPSSSGVTGENLLGGYLMVVTGELLLICLTLIISV